MSTNNQDLENLEIYKYSPSSILNLSFSRLNEILEDKYTLPSVSNPFVYLIENSAINTSLAIQEYTLLTKRLYPRLANNEKDLYLHMSDYDYLGIFSEPSFAYIEFYILYSDFIKYAHFDPITSFYTFKIPRNLKVKIGKYIFSLTHPIIITKSVNNIINVKFDSSLENDLFPLETNYINFDIYSFNANEKYINFKVRAPEIDIETLEIPLQRSGLIKNTINFNPSRQFYYFEAYYLDNSNTWKKMLITHTNEVYDINTPTLCINVNFTEKSIDYYLPNIYLDSDLIKDKIKVLIYTTNGYINVNFSDYKLEDFSTEYNNVFPEYELDDTTTPLQLITKMVFIRDKIIGGKNGLSFNEVKEAVINNSIGDRKLPITEKQLEFYVNSKNFKLIKNLDIITNRIYGLEIQPLKPELEYFTSNPDFDIIEFKTTLENLTYFNQVYNYTDKIKIIPFGTLFKITNKGMELLTNTEVNKLNNLSGINLAVEINANKYISSYYHYILDCSKNENELRVYELNFPSVDKINFKDSNDTIKISLNTISSNMYLIPNGYRIDIMCNYKKYLDTLTYNDVKPYLVYEIENSYFFIEGNLYTVMNEKPVYRFDIHSNFFIDENDKIYITNAKDINGLTTTINIDLNTKLNLIFVVNISSNTYTPIEANKYIENSYLSLNRAVLTHEIYTITFGYSLQNLYHRLHVNTSNTEYETYTEDIPLRYEYNVYDDNNNIIHYKNDIVYDENNEIVYKYRAGDVKLDENNKPITISDQKVERYLSLLIYDYKLHRSDSDELVKYKNNLRLYMLEQIYENTKDIQSQLLENTEAFVVLPKTIDYVLVKINNKEVRSIYSQQKFIFNIYVTVVVYNNNELKQTISKIISQELSNYLENNTILRKTEFLDILYNKLKDYSLTINIEKFTELNSEYMEIVTTSGKISIEKIFEQSHNGYIIKDNIVTNFVLIS